MRSPKPKKKKQTDELFNDAFNKKIKKSVITRIELMKEKLPEIIEDTVYSDAVEDIIYDEVSNITVEFIKSEEGHKLMRKALKENIELLEDSFKELLELKKILDKMSH